MTRFAAWRARPSRFSWPDALFQLCKEKSLQKLSRRRKRSMKNLEGKKAPAFSLEGSDGKNHSLEDYKGKTVVLYFYPKDNTPGCTKEACGFRDLTPSLKKSGAVVLGVSRDSIPSHNKFVESFKLPFVLLS